MDSGFAFLFIIALLAGIVSAIGRAITFSIVMKDIFERVFYGSAALILLLFFLFFTVGYYGGFA